MTKYPTMIKYQNFTLSTFMEYMIKNHRNAHFGVWRGIWINDKILSLNSKFITLYYYPKTNKWELGDIKVDKFHRARLKSIIDLISGVNK